MPKLTKQAEIEDVRIHDLRHSFASFAVSQGMSIAMIGRLLGHSQVQTTARYGHTHLANDTMVGNTRMVSNPRGYFRGFKNISI